MKKHLLATAFAAVSTALFAPSAFAQAENFTGFSVLGGYNAASSTIDVTYKAGTNAPSATSTSGNGALQAEYTLMLAPQITIGVGLNVGLGDLKFGTWIGSNTDVLLREASSAYVAPGYALNNTTLLFGKVASVAGKATNVDGVNSAALSGMGYGLGARIVDGHLFYQVEYMQNHYSDRETATAINKFKSSLFSFGVGYKF